MPSTTRKPHLKRKDECTDCGNFIGNRKTYGYGSCKKGLKTTCYRQSRNKCDGYEFDKDWME